MKRLTLAIALTLSAASAHALSMTSSVEDICGVIAHNTENIYKERLSKKTLKSVKLEYYDAFKGEIYDGGVLAVMHHVDSVYQDPLVTHPNHVQAEIHRLESIGYNRCVNTLNAPVQPLSPMCQATYDTYRQILRNVNRYTGKITKETAQRVYDEHMTGFDGPGVQYILDFGSEWGKTTGISYLEREEVFRAHCTL